MEEQIVSFETASLLKKMGIAINCCYQYNTKTENFYFNSYGVAEENEQYILIGRDDIFNKRLNRPEIEWVLAPTQSLLQKWLRDEHRIYVMVEETFTEAIITHIGFYAKVIKPNPRDEEGINTLYYGECFCSTYEQALEEGLFQGLGLLDSK